MKIMCFLPNASECISGIEFKKEDGVMVSVKDIDDLDTAVVEKMLSIDGYALQATPEEAEALPEDATVPEAEEAPVPEEAPVKTTRGRTKKA